MAKSADIRVCGNKVRSGCLTCKSRRVKCDEAKPNCQRCTRSRRVCTYSRANNLRLVVYTPQAPWTSYADSKPKKDALYFFISHTSRCFPAAFTQPLLRVANASPPIAHAIISLSALQRLYEFDEPSLSVGLRHFASEQYGKGLRLLRENNTHPPDIVLSCCVLFASFECLRGGRRAAVTHIWSGLELLRDYGSDISCELVSRTVIRSLFTRLDNQLVELLGTALGRTMKQQAMMRFTSPILDESGGVDLEVDDLGDTLDGILNDIFHEKLDLVRVLDGEPISVYPQPRKALMRRLEEWYNVFLTSVSSSNGGICTRTGYDFDILRIWYMIGQMFLSIRPGDPEDTWGQFGDEFENLIRLAENFLGRRAYSKRSFSFSLGVISPLFITAIRCRSPPIRQKAIDLLSLCQRREGLWDSNVAAQAAKHIMDIESLPAAPGNPSSFRVGRVTVVLDDEDGAKLEFE